MIAGESLSRLLFGLGLRLNMTPDGGLSVSPAEALTDELRAVIRDHKAELIAFVCRSADVCDDRRLCGDCAAFDGRHCHRSALSGLSEPGEIARILQRCPGFQARQTQQRTI